MAEYYPKINVMISPHKVTRGQLISITANIIDEYTSSPMAFENIYMQIIDEKGVEAWPTSLMEVESVGFSKLISTAELESGQTYTVRVSPSKKLSPIGVAT